ncbi:MAG TPA: hypothetical protein VND68_09830 [Chloroflexia bacterium]|jgi:hypothetical protein|nr:hypothetical protein [Chloroflexia bacterium]
MAKDEDSKQQPDTSQFFLVRLWADTPDSESRSGGDKEDPVRGKVQHVLSGEAESFNDWPTLMDALKGMMYGTRRSS